MSDQQFDDLRKQISDLQPGLEVSKSSDFVKGVQLIRMSRAVAWLTSAIALIIGAIGMLNTMIMSVFERTKEIGTLRAIGWKRSRIVRMVVGESMLLSVGGAILGSIGGVLLAKLLTKLPAASGLVSGEVGTHGHRARVLRGDPGRRGRLDLPGLVECESAADRGAAATVGSR